VITNGECDCLNVQIKKQKNYIKKTAQDKTLFSHKLLHHLTDFYETWHKRYVIRRSLRHRTFGFLNMAGTRTCEVGITYEQLNVAF
jgi:hypothetical protein